MVQEMMEFLDCEADPEIGRAVALEDELARQQPEHRADRLGKHRLRGRDGGHGVGADQQVRRGLPRQAVLRRLPVCGRGGGAGPCSGPASSSARSTPTCSPTPAPRPTWRCTLPCCEPGDTVLGMNLAHGGHLTHGSPVNMSGKYYHIVPYGVDARPADHRLRRSSTSWLRQHKPKLIVAGASAYPRDHRL